MVGPDMTRFLSSKHAAAWRGICPGNHQSAGKRHSGKTRKGNRWLRVALVETARVASRQRGTYFHAQYRHLVRRRGDKKAAVAVAHSLLVAAYHVLRDGVPFRDLGPDHFQRVRHDHLLAYHRRRS